MSAEHTTRRPSIGVIGGSGLYRLFGDDAAESVVVETPYGPPSAPVAVGELAGRTVVFLPRHGEGHSVPPHRINYRANIWALASLGVEAIVSSSAVGGIDPECRPGRFVLPDQFIDRTRGRADTFYDDDIVGLTGVQHLAAADPYCPALHSAAAEALALLGEDVVPYGTSVVIQGPRFSTRAESRWFRAAGAHIVNMTQYPEVALAAELNIGTVNLSFVTDTDAGDAPATGAAAPAEEPVDGALVLRRLVEAQPRILAAISAIVRAIPGDYAPRPLLPGPAVAAVLGARAVGAPAASGASPR